jgi:predicted nucleic acid-binding protein
VVTDASIWVSRLLPVDAHHGRSVEWFQGNIQSGAQLTAPWLLLVEVAGAIARRTERADLGVRAAEAIIATRSIRLVAPDRRLWALAVKITADARLRGADALYVATAHDLGLPLVTLDLDQGKRASRLVPVITPNIQ